MHIFTSIPANTFFIKMVKVLINLSANEIFDRYPDAGESFGRRILKALDILSKQLGTNQKNIG